MNTILDSLRVALTPNAEAMLERGELVPGVTTATKKNPQSQRIPCRDCGHERTFIKNMDVGALCAACLSFTAKMPCHKTDGLMALNSKSAQGMGLLVTPDDVRFYALDRLRAVEAKPATRNKPGKPAKPERNMDLIFLDTVSTTRLAGMQDDPFLVQALPELLALPDGAFYWFGILFNDDAHAVMSWLKSVPWNIAQDTLFFQCKNGKVFSDTRASWRSVLFIKSNPEYTRITKNMRRICLEENLDQDKREKRLAALSLHEHPDLFAALSDLNDTSLATLF